MGDAHMSSSGLMYSMDAQAFHTNFLQNINDDQSCMVVSHKNKHKVEKHSFEAIIDMDGPLTGEEHVQWKGCMCNLQIEWTDGSASWEPVNKVAADSPEVVADYVISNNLGDWLDLDLWGGRKTKEKIKELCSSINKMFVQ